MPICCALGMVNRQVDITMASQGVSFTGETVVLNSDTLLASGIQLTGQQLDFQFLDDGWESCFQLVYCHLCPFANQ
ncbi:hypothetical protein KAM385_31870 [Aeromonas hydrophila]|nr:hypothetical protein KAM385_31870 [Aeromonas hydrophila]